MRSRGDTECSLRTALPERLPIQTKPLPNYSNPVNLKPKSPSGWLKMPWRPSLSMMWPVSRLYDEIWNIHRLDGTCQWLRSSTGWSELGALVAHGAWFRRHSTW